jgi:hypothetical protein
LVERGIDEEPKFKSRRPIDMNIIERIKALRANTVDRQPVPPAKVKFNMHSK